MFKVTATLSIEHQSNQQHEANKENPPIPAATAAPGTITEEIDLGN